jgi:hypothetical protein
MQQIKSKKYSLSSDIRSDRSGQPKRPRSSGASPMTSESKKHRVEGDHIAEEEPTESADHEMLETSPPRDDLSPNGNNDSLC